MTKKDIYLADLQPCKYRIGRVLGCVVVYCKYLCSPISPGTCAECNIPDTTDTDE